MKPRSKGLREAAGSAKQKAGEIVGNPKLEVEGLNQKLAATVHKKIGKIEKAVGK